MIGSTISHYRIIEEIGHGGMGVVYKAEDTKLKRIVALKFLPKDLTGSREEKARFTQEAQAAATINHPNVCIIYRIDEVDGQQFIEMEYVDGSTLRRLVPIGDLATVVRYARQIAEGLNEAHLKGIVHRDVKSENIMVNSAGQIKVMDFGLAKLKGSLRLTKTSSTVGTLGYMSPEQIQGEAADARSDQFSLGVVLFEMLTGRLPFRGEHDAAIMYSIVNEEPASVADLRPDTPDSLQEIISRLLSKSPGDRYARTEDLVSELRACEMAAGRKPAGGSGKGSGGRPVRPRVSARWLPVALAAVVLIAGFFLFRNYFGSGTAPVESIAVLPFKNIGGDPNTEYLSDGISEHIINALSQLRKMRVIPRSTAFHYKGKEDDATAVGNELNVNAILSGRVIQRGEDLNIQVELIDVRQHSQLWGEQYTRKLSDLLSVQDDIVRAVGEQLHISGDETTSITKRSTESNDAYQLYLKGRYYWDKRSVAGFGKALQFFQQALDIDPNYALAYAGMADCYDLLGLGIYNGLPPREAYPKANAALEKAFALDSNLSEAYATRAHMNHSFVYDWPQVEHDYRKAIEINPKYASAHVFFASYLNAMGRRDEAMQEYVTAQQLEPLSLPINVWLGIEYYYHRDYDKSIDQIRRSIDIDAGFPNAYYFLAWPMLMKGMVNEAEAQVRIGRQLAQDNPVMIAAQVYMIGRRGNHPAAVALLDTLRRMSSERYISPHNLAIAYIGVGDTVNFYKSLAQTVDEHAFIVSVSVLRVDPVFDFARNDPRFIALMRKAGLK